jgi:hypothetical protein
MNGGIRPSFDLRKDEHIPKGFEPARVILIAGTFIESPEHRLMSGTIALLTDCFLFLCRLDHHHYAADDAKQHSDKSHPSG